MLVHFLWKRMYTEGNPLLLSSAFLQITHSLRQSVHTYIVLNIYSIGIKPRRRYYYSFSTQFASKLCVLFTWMWTMCGNIISRANDDGVPRSPVVIPHMTEKVYINTCCVPPKRGRTTEKFGYMKWLYCFLKKKNWYTWQTFVSCRY